MNRLVTIGKAAELLGVHITTLRRWEKQGLITPERTTKSGHRRYDMSKIDPSLRKRPVDKKTYAYARVSSHDQKADLERQVQVLQMYCAAQGWQHEIIQDLGSGLNYHKKGLKRLLQALLDNEVQRLVLTHKDRLLRFGSELIFEICEQKQVEVVIINQGNELSFEEELAQDVLEIITVFSAKLYGSRSSKNKKLIDAVKENLK
ncbi:IS607 family transposase [Moraxella sp. ZJ142]|uniref:IS607 family transposase n=1 Tax=Moraxella marmotae TaxID=3344520 RepID=UPI0035D4E5AC